MCRIRLERTSERHPPPFMYGLVGYISSSDWYRQLTDALLCAFVGRNARHRNRWVIEELSPSARCRFYNRKVYECIKQSKQKLMSLSALEILHDLLVLLSSDFRDCNATMNAAYSEYRYIVLTSRCYEEWGTRHRAVSLRHVYRPRYILVRNQRWRLTKPKVLIPQLMISTW